MKLNRILPLLCILVLIAAFSAGCTEEPSKKTVLPVQATGEQLIEETVTLDPSGSGTMTLPWINPGGILETDVKHHWDMPEGVVMVWAQCVWDDTSWEFEFSIGTGECPHTGQKLAGDSGSSGNLTIEYEADSGGTLETGQWFAHIACLNQNSHRGGSCAYTITVKLYTSAAEGAEE